MAEPNYPCYVATDPVCGHVVAAVVLTPGMLAEAAKAVKDWERRGSVLSVLSADEVRAAEWCTRSCPQRAERMV
jgi:hypothetical protein